MKFKGHDTAWGEAQAKDYVDHNYHKVSDEFHNDWSFEGLGKMTRFGFDLGMKPRMNRRSSNGRGAMNLRRRVSRAATKTRIVWRSAECNHSADVALLPESLTPVLRGVVDAKDLNDFGLSRDTRSHTAKAETKSFAGVVDSTYSPAHRGDCFSDSAAS